MLIKELTALREAKTPAMTHAQKFSAIKVGQKPDDKTKAVLQKLCDKAEKEMLRMVLRDPDNYGIDTYDTKNAEIRSGTNIWVTHIGVHENGYHMMMMVDTDDIGGSSDNHEDLFLDRSGKITNASHGEQICVLTVQDDFECEED